MAMPYTRFCAHQPVPLGKKRTLGHLGEELRNPSWRSDKFIVVSLAPAIAIMVAAPGGDHASSTGGSDFGQPGRGGASATC
jgi:hypothetical protein